MDQPLNLNIVLTPPPADSFPDILATITLLSDPPHVLMHTGDILKNPLSEEDEKSLRWYLEEYWQWPYEQFRERGEEIEEMLPQLGKQLYNPVFAMADAHKI